MIYLIGSLRNPNVGAVARYLRRAGFEVFDDWRSSGRHGDREWQRYETGRGRTYAQALRGAAAKNVFAFDRRNLDDAEQVVLVAPAGKSAHLELGWAARGGTPSFIFFPDGAPARWDVMLLFATAVHFSARELVADLHKHAKQRRAA